jgi:4-hydroxy-tetrahydrodipicolinate synthase
MKNVLAVEGVIPALIASMTPSEELDLDGIKTNVNHLVDQGIHMLLVNGSTGEAAALTRDEKLKVIETVKTVAAGRAKILAGCGAPSTGETVRNALDAKAAGADGLLIITPFYIIPTQEGVVEHYRIINDKVKHPIVAYNLPAHTSVDIQMETLEKLADLEYLCGLKESSGRGNYIAEALARVGKKIAILEGGDDVIFPSLCMGVDGTIVALGNIAPAQIVKMFQAVKSGHIDEARRIYFQILPIARAIAVSVSFPAGVKYAVEALGRPAGPTRSPIVALHPDEKEAILSAMKASGLI